MRNKDTVALPSDAIVEKQLRERKGTAKREARQSSQSSIASSQDNIGDNISAGGALKGGVLKRTVRSDLTGAANAKETATTVRGREKRKTEIRKEGIGNKRRRASVM